MSDVRILISLTYFDQEIRAELITGKTDALAFVGIKSRTFASEAGIFDFGINAVRSITNGKKGDTYSIKAHIAHCSDREKLTAILEGCGWSIVEPS